MLERLSWKKLVSELFLFCLPALVLSIFIGHLSWCLFASVFLALIWHGYNLLKLSDWLWLDRRMLPPSGRGGMGADFLRYSPNAATEPETAP
ncbi:hypothetical protein O185_03240 [Photorhabdus temperata J3]|uniref:Phosphate regulon sensor protein PhoR N-terminal domain-containing protein n=1 Tax=Photorhabdus temperata J3 TaxID=1389415 RepID=U7R3T1_PHOTE|nr:hypothetical protein O185_03240 [Photorhabdus temperata J3]